jgi:hypothetical protein
MERGLKMAARVQAWMAKQRVAKAWEDVEARR